eukprot:1963035-Amphidinium_carterae.1
MKATASLSAVCEFVASDAAADFPLQYYLHQWLANVSELNERQLRACDLSLPQSIHKHVS